MSHSNAIFRIGIVTVVAACVLMAIPPTVFAQDGDREFHSWKLQRFHPAPGAADYITLFGTGTAGHMDWNAGSFFNYADEPMLVGAVETRGVAYQAHLDVMGSIGLFDVVEVGLTVPWTIRQRGEDLEPIWPDSDTPAPHLQQMALNDLRLTSKYQIFGLDDEEMPIALAAVGGLTIPVGNSGALGGDGGFGAEISGVAEYVLYQTIRFTANLGFRYRPGSRVVHSNTLGNEVTWGIGAHSPFITDDLDVLAELTGAVGVQPRPEHLKGVSRGEVPAELLGAMRWGFHDEWSLTGGMGTSINDGVGTPNWRFFIGIDGKWATGGWLWVDYTNPNFQAYVDPCEGWDPDQHVRRLRFDPREDCPDPEPVATVGDDPHGILDEPTDTGDWEPPERPEDKEDTEGDATLRHGAIMLTENINFETGSAEIRGDSHQLLEDVATLLNRNPEIRLVRIEGHTDSVGPASMNLELSEDRAASVVQFLTEAGVDRSRMESIGYGESRPVADNDTAEGRAVNRRVEFNVLEFD